MQRTRVFCLFALAAVASAWGETPSVARRVVTLDNCVQMALQRNLDIRIQRFNPDVARLNLSSLYGAYDPGLSLAVREGQYVAPPYYDPQTGILKSSESSGNYQAFDAGISGVLPWGTTYRLGANLSDQNDMTRVFGTNVFSSTVRGDMGVLQLRQPLMRDFWIDGTRYQIALAKNSLRISELGVRQQIMATVTAVESAYLTLSYAFDEVKVQELAVELAEKLLSENKKRVEVGAMAPLDEKQAEAQLASSRADLLTAQRNLSVAQNTLKSLLTDDYASLHTTEFEPAAKLVALPVALDVQESWSRALTQRPDLLQARLNLDRLGVALTYQKNQIYPRFDAVGAISYTASSRDYQTAFEQWGSAAAPSSYVGVEFAVPLGNRTARNNYKSTKAQREQEELRVKQLEQGIMVAIDNAITLVRTSLERVNATREARVYSQAALDAEVKKLENGKSTSFEVLRLQRDVTSSMSAEIQALAGYNIALSQLALAEGSTLERNQLGFDTK